MPLSRTHEGGALVFAAALLVLDGLGGRLAAGQPVGHLVDGAIASDSHHDVHLGRVPFGENDCFLGLARGVELAFQPAFGKALLHRVSDGARPAPAGLRVEDDRGPHSGAAVRRARPFASAVRAANES